MSRIVALIAALACFAAGPASAQLTAETTQIRPEKIRDNLYAFFGYGGNIGVLIGPDGVVLVDDQYGGMSPKIEAAVKALTPIPIKYVLSTHWHYDHTGENENFGKSGAIIVAHDNTRTRLISGGVTLGVQIAPMAPAGLPLVTFADRSTLHVNGQTVQMIHTPPGHTDSDVTVFFKEANVMHTGDAYTNPSYPLVDPDSAGTLRGVIAARKQMLALCGADCVIIPGHGPLSNAEKLKASIAMLEEMDKRVTKAVASKKSLADFLASNPTADYDKVYSPRPDQGKVFITRAYEERVKASGKK